MAGENVTVTRKIEAPPERVWELVSDVTRMGEWSPETEACRWVDGSTGPEVGAAFRGRNRIGVRRWSTTCTVTACEPGRVFAFDVRTGPFPVATWSYELEPDGDGCIVRERWLKNSGSFMNVLGWVATGVADRTEHNRRNMETTLERIAAVAEQS